MPEPRFEVASIRPVLSATEKSLTTSGPRLTAKCYSASELIGYTFSVEDYQIEGAELPGCFDIAAKAEDSRAPGDAEFRAMTRTLLAERFALRFHRVTKTLPVYALAPVKGGIKLKRSMGNEPSSCSSGRNGPAGSFEILCRNGEIDDLADELTDVDDIGRPVIDRTELSGTYDIDLIYARQSDADAAGGDIFTALRDQLGLRLVPRKERVQVLVVDRVENPSAN